MTKSDGDDDFFIGWGKTSRVDRRFLLRASIGLVTLAAGAGALLAARQSAPGDGSWNPDDDRDWAGVLVSAPYPMLRTRAIDGTMRTAYLVSSNKLGVQTRIGQMQDGLVVVRGSLIARGKNAMIAVVDGDAWIRTASSSEAQTIDVGAATWRAEDLGTLAYVGEILDSKCWFGAMQPGQGKPHKSCAALCIRGGLPPVFCPKGLCGEGDTARLITDPAGNAHGDELLPLVADTVFAEGRIVRIGDVTQFRVALADIVRM